MTVFPCYSLFLSPRIVKTANTKPANNLYLNQPIKKGEIVSKKFRMFEN